MMPLRILVVDDEPAICENLSDILEDFGHEVHWESDPESAIKAIEDNEECIFDVAILDFKMPKMNGAELLQRIRTKCPDLIAILVSAFCDALNSEDPLENEFNEIIEKPLDVSNLLKLLDGLTPLVLCVDDDKDFCDSLFEIFEHKGINASFSHDVEAAKKAIQSNAFDVVIIDLKLPDGDGSETLRTVNKQRPATKTILITGYPDRLEHKSPDLPDIQPDAVFLKPIDPAQLMNVIFRLSNQPT